MTFSAVFNVPSVAHPHTIVCDGTTLGFRKDLLVAIDRANLLDECPTLAGTKHEERILIRSPKARELLLKFTGITRDRKMLHNPNPLTETEVKSLCSSHKNEQFKCLADLVSRVISETRSRTCPEPYREFLSEIARSSPACGLLQLGSETEKVKSILLKVASNTIDIQDSTNHHDLTALQVNAPVLSEFICKCPKNYSNNPCDDVCAIIHHIIQKVISTFVHSAHPPQLHSTSQQSHVLLSSSPIYSWSRKISSRS